VSAKLKSFRLAAPFWRSGRLDQETRRVWLIFRLAIKTFVRIDGVQWAGAFAFNAFFSLFPLIILVIAITSVFIDRIQAGGVVIEFIEGYIPIGGEMQRFIFNTISDVVEARGPIGAISSFILIWGALQCFTTLITVTNRAWGVKLHSWWRLPLKSVTLLGITAGAILLGIALPVMMNIAESWFFTTNNITIWVDALTSYFIPLMVVFASLSLFYKLAPLHPKRFSEVWIAALSATVLLAAGESLFVVYMNNFATLNAIYGAFGGIMALLLWIYLSGCFFIFGACLCFAQAKELSEPAEPKFAL
jgi:Ca2+-transporting ATPase